MGVWRRRKDERKKSGCARAVEGRDGLHPRRREGVLPFWMAALDLNPTVDYAAIKCVAICELCAINNQLPRHQLQAEETSLLPSFYICLTNHVPNPSQLLAYVKVFLFGIGPGSLWPRGNQLQVYRQGF